MTHLITKILFLLTFIFWSYQLIFTKEQWIFLDYANLIIHETGHLIFIFTGQFFDILAGSLFQILVPVITFIYFYLTHQKLAIIFSIFWIGNNLINVSHYIKDARNMQLDLAFGASIHDWNWILNSLNLLKYDHILGNLFFISGIIFICLSLLMLVNSIIQDFQIKTTPDI
jgi:hypothetical protein